MSEPRRYEELLTVALKLLETGSLTEPRLRALADLAYREGTTDGLREARDLMKAQAEDRGFRRARGS